MPRPDFEPFPKIPRLNRSAVVTEKIDGTNAGIRVTEEGEIFACSRSRWITPEQDNYGFASWVEQNKADLLKLGPGLHWGEWWGLGIQRGYGLHERRFSLFNAIRWSDHSDKKTGELVVNTSRPLCCHVVPILAHSAANISDTVQAAVEQLRNHGSAAAPGFMQPEGVVVYHSATRGYFKVTLENDDTPKSQQETAE